MNTFKLLLISLVAGFVASSCTFRQEITFNEDMSGAYAFQVDMKEYIDFMKSMSAMGGEEFDFKDFGDSLGMQMNDVAAGFENVEGISNAVSYFDKEAIAIAIKYDFKNIDAVNQSNGGSMLGMDAPKENSQAQYFVDKKSFTFKMGKDLAGQLLGEDPSMSEMMGSMMNFEMKFNFPFDIKSVSNARYSLSENKRTVEAAFTLEEILAGKEGLDVTVKW
jgi:uncharacterized lipoprotein YehR (DUF1307 family)